MLTDRRKLGHAIFTRNFVRLFTTYAKRRSPSATICGLFIVHSSGLRVGYFNQTKNFSRSSGVSGGLSRCFRCGGHVRFIKFFVLFFNRLATLRNKSSSEIPQALIAASM